VNELNRQFSDQIDFFYLDVDQPVTSDLMAQLDVRSRSTYVLLAPDGAELARWVGPINLASMQTQIENKLAE
jgi:hypothetical protein